MVDEEAQEPLLHGDVGTIVCDILVHPIRSAHVFCCIGQQHLGKGLECASSLTEKIDAVFFFGPKCHDTVVIPPQQNDFPVRV